MNRNANHKKTGTRKKGTGRRSRKSSVSARMKKIRNSIVAVITVIAILLFLAGRFMGDSINGPDRGTGQKSGTEQRQDGPTGKRMAEATRLAERQNRKSRQAPSRQEKAAKVPQSLEIPRWSDGKHPRPKDQDVIIAHKAYTLSYNQKTKIPNWVAWELTAREAQGELPRKDKFAEDPLLQGPQATLEDYRYSGWDRGHMAPAADMKWDKEVLDECFYLTNMCPQSNYLNGGDWKELEDRCRSWSIRHGSVFIVCGPVIGENRHGTIGKNKVTVPDKFYKVLLVPEKDKAGKATGKLEGIGFLFTNPNKPASRISSKRPRPRPLQYYVKTIDEIEELTGLDFFHRLPDAAEDRIEAHVDLNFWRLK